MYLPTLLCNSHCFNVTFIFAFLHGCILFPLGDNSFFFQMRVKNDACLQSTAGPPGNVQENIYNNLQVPTINFIASINLIVMVVPIYLSRSQCVNYNACVHNPLNLLTTDLTFVFKNYYILIDRILGEMGPNTIMYLVQCI